MTGLLSRFDQTARPASRGFTLVEIMIVVVIIGLLAAMALPAFRRVQRAAQNRRFISDLRIFCQAFETRALANGSWPPDGGPSGVPAGMASELRTAHWRARSSIGGQWDWDNDQFGFAAGISIYRPTVTVAQMQEIDALIDDGDLATGTFRQRSNGYIWVLEF